MPFAAKRPCTAPGCPELVDKGRCAKHQQRAAGGRGSWRERGYDSRWDRPGGIRQTHLAAHPLCVMCAAATPPRVIVATVVDHRVRWQSGATEAERQRLFADPSNLQSLCASCHGRKTAAVDGGFGR